MSTFQKYGLNRQNTAIEKALTPTAPVISSPVQVVVVERDDGATPPNDNNGSIRVTGRTHAALTNPPTGWESTIDYWEIVNGLLTVYGNNNTWDSFEFIVV